MDTNSLERLITVHRHHTRLLSLYLLLASLVIVGLLLAILWRLPAEQPSLTIFQRAIEDAAQAEERHVSHQLQAITPDNPSLVWRDGQQQLKVVSWMSGQAFDRHFAHLVGDPKGSRTPQGKPVIWVTLAPEIQAFCRGLKVDDPAFRLKQRLGLDPNRRYERFVEFWVAPGDLFRPCPDPETDDTTCELDFRGTPPPQVKNIADYRQYFVGLSASLYRHDGAPWTRLGYTYDWAYGRRGVGASEFVLAPDVPYVVDGAYPTDAYCSG